MILALDAMGGDFAPMAVVQGALDVLPETPDSLHLILVGDEQAIRKELPKQIPSRISIHPTSQIVTMEDRGASVIKSKPDSSLVTGIRLVKSKKADGFISAGNTGAVMATSLLLFGRIKGVRRPALGAYIPTVKGGKILCDVGANPEVKPYHLMQFAIMASHYYRHIEGGEDIKIGLVNIGAEPEKGSDLYQKAHTLLSQELPEFIGNIEGRHLLDSEANILVCDGFVGNTLLKFAEGWIKTLTSEIKSMIGQNILYRFAVLLLLPILKRFQKRYDYEEHGGTPLLGVNGISIITHGSASAKAIKNSILAAKKCIDTELIKNTQKSLSEHLGARE